MITANDAKEMSEVDFSTLQKRTTFELRSVFQEINTRTKSKGISLIYTFYKNYLKKDEFQSMLITIKESLLRDGFSWTRIPHGDAEKHQMYVVLISWDEPFKE